jgi:hypothetical protein
MSSSPIAAVLNDLGDRLPSPAAHPVPITDGDQRTLLEALSGVPDPRRRRGVRYQFTPLLAAVVCAMLAGARSFAAIAEWIGDLSDQARDTLALTGPVPAGSTLWRLLIAVDGTALQAALGAWLRAQVQPAGRPAGGGRGRRRVHWHGH